MAAIFIQRGECFSIIENDVLLCLWIGRKSNENVRKLGDCLKNVQSKNVVWPHLVFCHLIFFHSLLLHLSHGAFRLPWRMVR